MDSFGFDDDDYLHETREERLAFDEELQTSLLQNWNREDKYQVERSNTKVAAKATSTTMTATAGPSGSKNQEIAHIETQSVQELHRPSGINLALTVNIADPQSEIIKRKEAKMKYIQELNKQLKPKSNLSRSTSAQEPTTKGLESTIKARGKPKQKAPSLPVPTLPTLEEHPPLSAVSAKPTRPLKTIRIPASLQVILDNFANFTMIIESMQSGAKVRVKTGKGMVAIDKGNLTKLSDIFKGCVVAVVHHISAKGDQLLTRWRVVHRHGGKVCVRFTPEVTHIACEAGVSDSSLCHYLGINDLSELPKGIPIVRWHWVLQSLSTGKPQAPDVYLHFKTQTAAPRRLSSTSTKRKGEVDIVAATTLNKRSKKYAATDSDTSQSQRNPVYIPTQDYATSPEPMDVEDGGSDKADNLSGVNGKGKAPAYMDNQDQQVGNAIASGSRHDRWLPPVSGEAADALDEIISGFTAGTLVETEQDLDEEAELLDQSKLDRLANATRMIGSGDGDLEMQAMRSDGPYKCQNAHTGNKGVCVNEDIVKGLERLGKVYENMQHKTSFERSSYPRAAGIVRNHPVRITSMEQALRLRFIGHSMAARIGEIIENGGVSDRERFEDNEQARTVTAFGDIYGVGPTRANELWNAGARSLNDLKEDCKKELKDSVYKLTEAQRIGLQYYDDLKSRMTRLEAERLFASIKKQVKQIDGCGERENKHLHVEAMGSYRRGEDTSGDLDILITRDPSDGKNHSGILRKLITKLSEKKIIEFTLSAPSNYEDLEAKWMGMGRVVGPDGKPQGPMRRIDILMIPWESYGAALIYFTGNEIFNRSLRLYARRNGFSLNQRGLYKGVIRNEKNQKVTEGVLVASRTEQEIFDALGVRYRPPYLRRP